LKDAASELGRSFSRPMIHVQLTGDNVATLVPKANTNQQAW